MRSCISYLPVGNITGCAHNSTQGLCRSGLEAIGMSNLAEGQIGEDAPTVAPPDWESINEEIACPLCEYNLRGLTEPRCPECGYRFTWREMLDPTRQLHRYLFEHHFDRRVWAFFRTLCGHLVPMRFWRQLHPNQPSRPVLIFLYWSCIAIVYLVTIAISVGYTVPTSRANNRAVRFSLRAAEKDSNSPMSPWIKHIIFEYGSLQTYLDSQYPTSALGIARVLLFGNGNPFGAMLIFLFLWPWLTMAAFALFRRTLGRANVRPSHLMRISVYSCDVILLPLLGLLVNVGADHVARSSALIPLVNWRIEVLCALFGIAAITWLYRLVVAFMFYLRFERPITVVLLSQFILFLIAVNIFAATVYWQ
jgi:hypothetical protein